FHGLNVFVSQRQDHALVVPENGILGLRGDGPADDLLRQVEVLFMSRLPRLFGQLPSAASFFLLRLFRVHESSSVGRPSAYRQTTACGNVQSGYDALFSLPARNTPG